MPEMSDKCPINLKKKKQTKRSRSILYAYLNCTLTAQITQLEKTSQPSKETDWV